MGLLPCMYFFTGDSTELVSDTDDTDEITDLGEVEGVSSHFATVNVKALKSQALRQFILYLSFGMIINILFLQNLFFVLCALIQLCIDTCALDTCTSFYLPRYSNKPGNY